MKTMIIADVHANLTAFKAILDQAGNFDEMIFLGDIANFGPNPSECVDLLRECNPICIMGNHDKIISSSLISQGNAWDKWSKEKLSDEQLKWIGTFLEDYSMKNMYFLHGAYNVNYDILPNTSDQDIKNAFKLYLPSKADTVMFGHYHYEIDRKVDGVSYHCIRPVGQQRDKDIRASYSMLENGNLIHYRVPYDIEELIFETKQKVDCYVEQFLVDWIDFLKNAYSEKILKKDLAQMGENRKQQNYLLGKS